jgi:UDP-glucose 4-epimerase
MNLLVTGGAGYIGSIMVKMLLDEGYFVIVADNLSRGHRDAVDSRAKFVKTDIRETEKLVELMRENSVEVVLHFAGVILMGESMSKPDFYFENNFCGSLGLLKAMVKAGVGKLVFSSSAGVYGAIDKVPILESAPKKPTNPYGESKLMVERALRWFWETKGIASISLRYYNPAGASLDNKLGERHKPESHIIPLALKTAKVEGGGKLEEHHTSHITHHTLPFTLYGDDYDTPDGTCIRDYIHVLDLCRAHLLALESLCKQARCDVYNVGTGKGYSNSQVIDTVKKVTGVDFKVKIAPRRAGDAAELVADATKIKRELGWQPERSNLEEIIKSAWRWEKSLLG